MHEWEEEHPKSNTSWHEITMKEQCRRYKCGYNVHLDATQAECDAATYRLILLVQVLPRFLVVLVHLDRQQLPELRRGLRGLQCQCFLQALYDLCVAGDF